MFSWDIVGPPPPPAAHTRRPHTTLTSSDLTLLDLQGFVRIADFGISHVLAHGRVDTTSKSGTTAYMSPESLGTSKAHGKTSEYVHSSLVTRHSSLVTRHSPLTPHPSRPMTLGIGSLASCCTRCYVGRGRGQNAAQKQSNSSTTADPQVYA